MSCSSLLVHGAECFMKIVCRGADNGAVQRLSVAKCSPFADKHRRVIDSLI